MWESVDAVRLEPVPLPAIRGFIGPAEADAQKYLFLGLEELVNRGLVIGFMVLKGIVVEPEVGHADVAERSA